MLRGVRSREVGRWRGKDGCGRGWHVGRAHLAQEKRWARQICSCILGILSSPLVPTLAHFIDYLHFTSLGGVERLKLFAPLRRCYGHIYTLARTCDVGGSHQGKWLSKTLESEKIAINGLSKYSH
jgi:hypothetical protein